MKVVRIFNPLHVLGNKIEIEVMKTEVMKYQTLVGSISHSRKRRKGKDTFDSSDWWKSNCVTLPGFTYVFRAVLTNSPNSCRCS